MRTTRLAALALLNVEVGRTVGRAVATVPVDGLDGVVTVALDGEVSVTAVGEEALVVNVEADSGGALGDGTGVRTGETDGSRVLLDDVHVLPAGRGRVLGSEGDGAGVGSGVD